VLCPLCSSRSVGKVGTNQFYCWDCCIEFTHTRDGVHLYRLDDEGGLVSLTDEDIAYNALYT